MKRRILAMLLTLVMVFAMATCAFATESGTDASAALSLEVTPGEDSAVVSVYLQGCNGVTNGRFSVSYDADAMTLVSAETSDAYAMSSVNDQTAGTVSLAWVNSQLTADKTLMLTLTFQVDPTLMEDVTFTAQNEQAYAGSTAVEVADGSAVLAFVPENPFVDIAGHWAEDEIILAYNAGLVKGVTDTEFVPDASLTRSMFVTILYRMAGEPEVEGGELSFTDLRVGAYYEDAVEWAVEVGVAKGLSSTEFAPNKSITRQEMMTMLYRYAKLVDGQDVSAAADLSVFADGSATAGWAKAAMQWALAQGLVKGYPDGTLLPKATATRAQSAAILCRYLGL